MMIIIKDERRMGGDGRKVCSMILTSAWRFILIIFFSKIIYIFHFCLYFHFFF